MTPEVASEALDAILSSEYEWSDYRAEIAALEFLAEAAGRQDEIRERVDQYREWAEAEELREAERAYKEAHPRSVEELLVAVLEEDYFHRDMTNSEREIWDALPTRKRNAAEFEGAVRREVRDRKSGTWRELPGGATQAVLLPTFGKFLHDYMVKTEPARRRRAAQQAKRMAKLAKASQEKRAKVLAEVERRLKEETP